MKNSYISDSVILRLPRYYRFLSDLKTEGVLKISSRELSERMGLTASQIRQDLNCFGGFGQQGYGYNIEFLKQEIAKVLCLDKPTPAILLGLESLGRAIAQQTSFENYGFQLIGLFDNKESLVGQTIRNIPVRSMLMLDEFCRESKPQIAILCLTKEEAQAVAEPLIRLGIKGFWNLGQFDLTLKNAEIPVQNVNLGDSLMTLSYKLSSQDKSNF